ncbi:MAG: DUF882 domain-containing protein [Hyphomicrobiales bacterium]|nr:DUF882 domain-containing protein [Hyphomicrobiales bacterium]
MTSGVFGLAALASTMVYVRETQAAVDIAPKWSQPRAVFARSVTLRHRQTGEFLKADYYQNGQYVPEMMNSISELLRDHRTNEVKPIDPALMDLLYAVGERLEKTAEFQIYSGYRSASTNARLRKKGFRAARNSLHMHGMAVDIGIEGTRSRDLYRAALTLERGGVGYYSRSSFVHVDVGKFRTWRR